MGWVIGFLDASVVAWWRGFSDLGFGVVIVWFGVELLRGFMVVAGVWWVGRVVGGGSSA